MSEQPAQQPQQEKKEEKKEEKKKGAAQQQKRVFELPAYWEERNALFEKALERQNHELAGK